MTLAKLIGAFESFTILPIEIPDVREQLVSFGFQDCIVFMEGDFDPSQLRGVFYQFTHRLGVYGETERCTLILYSAHLSPEWKRVVCCKELIHVLDGIAARTNTPDEVTALVEKLLGPLSNEDFGLADFQASKDKLALYQALAVLFPDDARAEILQMEPRPSHAEVAEWVCLPRQLVALVLSEAWPEMVQALLETEKAAEGLKPDLVRGQTT